jgi:hypothetical protein
MLEQRGLADAGVAMNHEDATVAFMRGLQQPFDHLALAFPADQPFSRGGRGGSSL